jgi:hypothetical protein
MVHLSEVSKINSQKQPFAHQWDTLVRKHFNKYQHLIDAQTYQLQRTQRLYFVSILLFSPSHTHGSTIQIYWFLIYSKRSKQWEKLSKNKSISIQILTRVFHLILIALSIITSMFPKLDWQSEAGFSLLHQYSTFRYPTEQCFWQFQFWLIGSEYQATALRNLKAHSFWIG